MKKINKLLKGKLLLSLLLIGLGITNFAKAVNIPNPDPNFFVETGNNTFLAAFQFFINMFLGFAATLALLFIIIGGYQYIFSGASEEMAATGKKTLTNAIIGIVVIILSYTIVTVIKNTFK